MKKVSLLLALALGVQVGQAQMRSNNGFSAASVQLGVFKWKSQDMATLKVGYDRGHFGINGDYTFAYSEKNRSLDGSMDQYRAMIGFINGRVYSGQGRGLFAEVGAGGTFNRLKTIFEGEVAVKKAGFVPLVNAGLGYRLGFKPKGLYGEIGVRSTMALDDQHLYTTAEKPQGSQDKFHTYHSFYTRKFAKMLQPSLSIGYSF